VLLSFGIVPPVDVTRYTALPPPLFTQRRRR
jgi:hypothetical protein